MQFLLKAFCQLKIKEDYIPKKFRIYGAYLSGTYGKWNKHPPVKYQNFWNFSKYCTKLICYIDSMKDLTSNCILCFTILVLRTSSTLKNIVTSDFRRPATILFQCKILVNSSLIKCKEENVGNCLKQIYKKNYRTKKLPS